MTEIIKNQKIGLRILTQQDKNLLLKWLTDKRVLNFWEGKSSIFDLDRITKEFYSEDCFEIIRGIIKYDGKSIGYVQMYKLDKDMLSEYEYPLTNKTVYGIDQFIGEPEYWGKRNWN